MFKILGFPTTYPFDAVKNPFCGTARSAIKKEIETPYSSLLAYF